MALPETTPVSWGSRWSAQQVGRGGLSGEPAHRVAARCQPEQPAMGI